VITRINVGGPAFTDSLGRLWSADTNFTGGSTFSTGSAIGNTVDDPLFQSERYGNPFSYSLPVANGTYTVRLRFAEIFFGAPGNRVFDVDMEGVKAIDDLDLFAAAGKDVAYELIREVVVTDGVLNIVFSSSVNFAKLSAIEVTSLTPSTTLIGTFTS